MASHHSVAPVEVSDLLGYLQDLDLRLSVQLDHIASSIASLQGPSENQPGGANRIATRDLLSARKHNTHTSQNSAGILRRGLLPANHAKTPTLLMMRPGHRRRPSTSSSASDGFICVAERYPPPELLNQYNTRCSTDPVLAVPSPRNGPSSPRNGNGLLNGNGLSSPRNGNVATSPRNSDGYGMFNTRSAKNREIRNAASALRMSYRRPSEASSVKPTLSKKSRTQGEEPLGYELSEADSVTDSVDSLGELRSSGFSWRLFHSMSDEVSHARTLKLDFDFEGGKSSPAFVMMPGLPMRVVWDVLVVLVTTLVIWWTPLVLVYLGKAADGSIVEDCHLWTRTYNSFSSTADVIWILDILLNFRTAFLMQGRVVCDPRLIAAAYARSWLLLDVLTAWPVACWPLGSADALRVFKMLRLLRLGNVLGKLQKELRSARLLPLKILLVAFLGGHILAALWRVVLRADGAAASRSMSELVASTWWLYYLQDVYWVMMTVTTTGYGDIVPRGPFGELFAMFTMLSAEFLNAAMFCLLTHVTKDFFDNDVHKQVVAAACFMHERKVPLELQRRVEHNLRSQLRQDHQLVLAQTLLSKLSANVQRELTLELLSKTVMRFPLFQGAPAAFIAEIAQAHTWVECSAGDLVAEEGQLEEDLVFVVLGQLFSFCTSSPRGGDAFAHMRIRFPPGAWFGEACLFESNNVRGSSIFARVNSEMVVLQANDYHEIVKKYPHLLLRHQSLQNDIRKGKVNLSELASPPPPEEAPVSKRCWFDIIRPCKAAKVVDESQFYPVLI